MPKPVQMGALAAKEARKAWLWYRRRSARAGGRFQQALEHIVEEIHKQPDRWPEYQHGTQFVRLTRFPYILVFRELDAEVQIVAGPAIGKGG